MLHSCRNVVGKGKLTVVGQSIEVKWQKMCVLHVYVCIVCMHIICRGNRNDSMVFIIDFTAAIAILSGYLVKRRWWRKPEK